MLALALAWSLAAAPDASLPWIADDWAGAKAQAIADKKLVAVDVWATWCHTCLSMTSFVLSEPPLRKIEGEHTWLMLDYDQPKNAAFFAKFPVAGFPSFLVIDPVKEEVVARWLGSGTAEEMAAFFASAAVDSKDPVILGGRALAQGRFEAAKEIFLSALRQPGGAKAARARLTAGLLEALSKLDAPECARRGAELLEDLDDSAPSVDATAVVAFCAAELEEEEARRSVEAKVRQRLTKTLENKSAFARLSVDDRSGLYSLLIELADGRKDAKEAEKLTKARLEMLEAAAKAAKEPRARATFDAHRLECYLRLKRYREAEAMLRASEVALPEDFNPPARLALLYSAQGEIGRGLAVIEQALRLGYGPRRARLHSTKIDLLIKAQRWPEAQAAVDAARADLTKLDRALQRPAWFESLDQQASRIKAR